VKIDWDIREWLAMPEEMVILEKFANQSGNIRSRKPSRLIWLYTKGASQVEILDDLRISEQTLEKYFARWVQYGVSGLTRLEHPELDRIYQ
jgi:hypothetical protein